MNIYPDQGIGGPPAPKDWTMSVGLDGLGESAVYYADVRRAGRSVCRLTLHGHHPVLAHQQRPSSPCCHGRLISRLQRLLLHCMFSAARHLAFHGSIVLLFGLLLGAPYARAIKRNAPAHIVNSWRVAHLSLPIGAILMFAIAAWLPSTTTPGALAWIIAIALIVSAYGFCVSTPLAALTGHRGLSAGHGSERLVYLGNMVGALASIVAGVALVMAAFISLRF